MSIGVNTVSVTGNIASLATLTESSVLYTVPAGKYARIMSYNLDDGSGTNVSVYVDGVTTDQLAASGVSVDLDSVYYYMESGSELTLYNRSGGTSTNLEYYFAILEAVSVPSANIGDVIPIATTHDVGSVATMTESSTLYTVPAGFDMRILVTYMLTISLSAVFVDGVQTQFLSSETTGQNQLWYCEEGSIITVYNFSGGAQTMSLYLSGLLRRHSL